MLLAWLDGPVVDDGTACEIGMFAELVARGDPRYRGIVGLVTDLRLQRRRGNAVGDGMNLFVIGAIEASGRVCWSVDEAVEALRELAAAGTGPLDPARGAEAARELEPGRQERHPHQSRRAWLHHRGDVRDARVLLSRGAGRCGLLRTSLLGLGRLGADPRALPNPKARRRESDSRQHDPCPPPLQQARLLEIPRASHREGSRENRGAREAAAAANLPQSAPAAEAVAEVFAPEPASPAKSPRKRKPAAWRSLPPAELAAHLLATPTIADSAWTTEPRLPRENRESFIRRILLGETPESATRRRPPSRRRLDPLVWSATTARL